MTKQTDKHHLKGTEVVHLFVRAIHVLNGFLKNNIL
jgi:hypothetical protein